MLSLIDYKSMEMRELSSSTSKSKLTKEPKVTVYFMYFLKVLTTLFKLLFMHFKVNSKIAQLFFKRVEKE